MLLPTPQKAAMNILSIQSHVAYGHVGNAAAVFPMQRLGVDVWPIHTVQFSNHTGYESWKGEVFSGRVIREVLQGIADRGVLPTCDGVVSGYLGHVSIGAAVLEAARKVKDANPKAMYCCDPVLGEIGSGMYVRQGIPEFMRDCAVPAADIVTPNQFELEYLASGMVRTGQDFRAAVEALHAMGPRVVVVTSLRLNDTPEGSIEIAVSELGAIARLRTPLLPLSISGAGDVLAAVFFVHFLRTGDAKTSLIKAGSSVYGILEQTLKAGSGEIMIVGGQDEFVSPSYSFDAEIMEDLAVSTQL
jgi:pyridoxine kinase